MKQKAAVVCTNRSADVCVRAWLDWGTLGGDGHSLGYGGGQFCTVTLDKTILYSWQSYRVMPLVIMEGWTGKVCPECRSFTMTLLKIAPVLFPGTVEQ